MAGESTMVKMETKYTGALGLSTLQRKPFTSAVLADWGAAWAVRDFGDFAFGFGADGFVAQIDKVCAADDFDGGEQPCGGCDDGGHAEHGVGDVDAETQRYA
jgi:hypothetical protein